MNAYGATVASAQAMKRSESGIGDGAVIGVGMNLSVWFAEHTIFGSVRLFHARPINLDIPQWAR